MKKLIAMILAIVLSLSMTVVAFAAKYGNSAAIIGSDVDDYQTASNIKPGDQILFDADDFEDYSSGGTTVTVDDDYMDSEYFSVKIEYDRGKDLVKDVKFDDGYVVLTLKDKLIEAPSTANFRIKSVTLTGKKNGVGASKAYRNKKFALKSSALNAFQTPQKVGYPVSPTLIEDYPADYADSENNIVKFTKTPDDISYGTIVIDFADLATAEVRVYKDEKYYFGTNTNADIDIVKANPDADLEFVNFVGRPSFSSNAKVEIFATDDFKYIYEIKDGKLYSTSFKYDDDAAAFVGKTRTLGYYVMSDKKLKASSTSESSSSSSSNTNTDAGNPDTGTNNMVGVAAALAAVSLVAAGAVSLKKK